MNLRVAIFPKLLRRLPLTCGFIEGLSNGLLVPFFELKVSVVVSVTMGMAAFAGVGQFQLTAEFGVLFLLLFQPLVVEALGIQLPLGERLGAALTRTLGLPAISGVGIADAASPPAAPVSICTGVDGAGPIAELRTCPTLAFTVAVISLTTPAAAHIPLLALLMLLRRVLLLHKVTINEVALLRGVVALQEPRCGGHPQQGTGLAS